MHKVELFVKGQEPRCDDAHSFDDSDQIIIRADGDSITLVALYTFPISDHLLYSYTKRAYIIRFSLFNEPLSIRVTRTLYANEK